MPLSFETFQGEVVVFNLSSSLLQDSYKIWDNKTGILQQEQEQDLGGGYVVGGGEPTSVLEALRSPSPLTSSSTTTLSSSHGGGAAATNTTVVFAGDDNNIKCSPQMDDLDGGTGGVIQEQSILRLIMDSSSSGGFGVFDPGFGFGSGSVVPGSVSQNLNPLFQFQEQTTTTTPHQISNQETGLMNPGLLYSQEDSPPAKRFNSGPVFPFSDPDPGHHDPFILRRHFQFQQQQIPSSSSSPVLAPFPSSRMAGDDSSSVIIEQLFNAAELIGNNDGDQTILAQGILARLNHSLTLLNAPFHRSALHISQALLSLTTTTSSSSSSLSPENQILKIAAYRSFTETSPFLQFVNFTSNQSIIESCEGYDQIHILDFDVGYGGQWSSLMQELSTRRNRVSLKLTCFVTPPSSVSEEFEIRFTEENLRSFADEIKIPFEVEFLSLELLLNPSYWPLSIRSSEKEVISVNLPVNSVISGYVPLILRYLKQITPNVVVCSDYGCDRNDVPFANGVIHSLQYWSNLIESLDSSGGNSSDDSSVERYWVKPCVEKMLIKRHRWMERCPPWRSLLTQCGFSPVSLSSTAVAQAECLVQRNNPVRGRFHVEKRQSLSSLVLCWQRKDLVSVSVWKC